MTVDAYAPQIDAATAVMSRVVSQLAEEAIFALAGSSGNAKDALEGAMKRRADAHLATLQGKPVARMGDAYDAWLIDMTRALAPVAPPAWLPMSEVIGEKVTHEAGARALRSLYSSKPSDKDVARVKRLGTLCVRVLRAVFAADGPIDGEENRALTAIVASLGLPDADAAPLLTEAPITMDKLDVYGELESGVARGLIRGAWLAAAWDAIDPREEQVIRALALKRATSTDEVEKARAEVNARVEARRGAGLAAVDGVRYVLADRFPGEAVQLAHVCGTLLLPRRYRDEALAQVAHGAPVTLAKRYTGVPSDDRVAALGVVWAAALHEDPTLARRSVLRARFDRFSADLGEEGGKIRQLVEQPIDETLALLASGLR